MHLLPLIPTVMICAAAVSPPALAQRAPVVDWQNPAAYVRALNASKSPEAAAIRKELAAAARNLARERELTRGAGLPVTPADLASRPLPPEQNAVTEYAALAELRKKMGADEDDILKALRLGTDNPPTEPETAGSLAALRRHRDALRLVHTAAGKGYSFPLDWSGAIWMKLPEHGDMRLAARLLAVESLLLAQQGHWTEAINTQTKGYIIAAHAASTSLLMSHLVATAIHAITTDTMASILRTAGPNEAAARLVGEAVRTNSGRFRLSDALGGEAVYLTATMAEVRREGFPALRSLATQDVMPRRRTRAPRQPAEVVRFTNQVLDALEARSLRHLRAITLEARKPYHKRRLADQREVPAETMRRNPVLALVALFTPVFSQAGVAEARMLARDAVVAAGSLVLQHRASRGSYPTTLEELGRVVLVDPFTGKPLGYRREPGGFVVYSVGPTGKFSGGAPGQQPRGEAVFRYQERPQGGHVKLDDTKPAWELKGARSAITRERFVVARTRAEFERLWKEHAPLQPLPEIDFTRQGVVAYFVGGKPTGGHTAEITALERVGDRLTVRVVALRPGPGSITTQAFTYPFIMRTVENLPARVEHEVEQRVRE